MNIDFISLEPGAFGELFYFRNTYNKLNQEEIDKFVNVYSNEVMHAYTQNDILNNRNDIDPITAYNKSRSDAKEILKKNSSERFRIDFQIGNKECMEYITEIESLPDFEKWEDNNLINIIKEDYLQSKR